jgi:AcrR family transcriptional regulator
MCLIMTALPKRDRRAERRAETRREIVDAAWEVARADGLAMVTLKAIAQRVGMQAPSLYSHFDSKNAIYDAMFIQAWSDVIAAFDDAGAPPARPRQALLWLAERFFDFSLADVARYQLMNRATVHDFQPSDEAYSQSLAAYERMRAVLGGAGVHRQADLDLWTAITGGAIDQQLANERGGNRWRRQLPRIVDMFADEVGIPAPRLTRKR